VLQTGHWKEKGYSGDLGVNKRMNLKLSYKKFLLSRPVSLYCRENILTNPQYGSIRVRLTSCASLVVIHNLLKTGILGKSCNDLYWQRNLATFPKFWF